MLKRWTDEEINKLTDLWGEKTVPQIARIMGRSINAIYVKSKRLNLGAQLNQNELLNASEVSRMLNVDIHTVTDYWAKSLGLKCKWEKLLTSGTFTVIKFKDLMTFLENNQSVWNANRVELFALGTEPQWLKDKRKSDFLNIPKRQAQNWTKAEDDILICMIRSGRYTQAQIADRLNRSRSAVGHRKARLLISSEEVSDEG